MNLNVSVRTRLYSVQLLAPRFNEARYDLTHPSHSRPLTPFSKVEPVAFADIARAFEDSVNKRGIVRRREQGWLPRIFPFTGYGSATSLYVLARAVMADPESERPFALPFLPKATHGLLPKNGPHCPPPKSNRPVSTLLDTHNATIDAMDDMVERASATAEKAQRGWRQFFTTQVGFLPVTVEIAGQKIETRTDTNGYINLLVEHHGLAPGWHEARITPIVGEAVMAPVVVVDPDATIGLVSDIDDTVVVTWLPRVFLAAWNSFVLRTNTRTPVPGMAEFYREMLADHPNAPVFYLSTGAWNTLPAMQEFIHANNLPIGPLLMTDWGPTPTGLFRSGQEHKIKQLRNLIITFPHIRWILVGDDGQHDPYIYSELAREHRDHVVGIAIRELNPVERVLSQGGLMSRDARTQAAMQVPHSITVISGKDGHVLLEKYRALRYKLGA